MRNLIILFSVILISCESSEICRDNTETPLRIGFYNSEDSSQNAIIDSLTVYGIGREDTLIYDNARNVTRIELPLNISSDTTSFVFVFPENHDTLEVIYERAISLISIGCGFVTFYSLNKINYSDNEIKDIYKEFNNIRNDLNEHLKIFISVASIEQ